MRVRLFSVAVAIVAVWACGESDETTRPDAFPASNLTQSEIDDLHDLANDLREDGILEPGVPLFLPVGVKRLPFDAQGGPAHATFIFALERMGTEPTGEPLAEHVDIGQGTGAAALLEDLTIDLGEVMAAPQIVPEGDHVSYVLQFRAGDRDVLVSIRWESPDGELTPVMKSQTELTAESVIADLHAQGLYKADVALAPR